jgi:hypothetical protein
LENWNLFRISCFEFRYLTTLPYPLTRATLILFGLHD